MEALKTYDAVKYLGGIPSYPSEAMCRLVVHSDGISLLVRRKFLLLHLNWRVVATVRLEDIVDVQVLPFLTAFPPATQDKSVIGRAVVGGLLLGPLGAVVGGMSGIGAKQKLTFTQAVHKNDFVLLIEAAEVGLRFRCGFVFAAWMFKEGAARKPFELIQRLRVEAARRAQLAVTAGTSPPLPTAVDTNAIGLRGNK